MILKSPEEMEAFVLQKALGAVILDTDVLKPVKKVVLKLVVVKSKVKQEMPR